MFNRLGCACSSRSLRLCLSPALLDHLNRQGIECPSRWTLQRSRIELDLASMIYSKRYVLNSSRMWRLHLRADSSPQGGRDYFVCEYDLVQFQTDDVGCWRAHSTNQPAPSLAETSVPELLQGGRIKLVTRLLPLSIIGCRAASAVHKGRHLLKALTLDSEDLRTSVGRTMTMLFDFGAEAGPLTPVGPFITQRNITQSKL